MEDSWILPPLISSHCLTNPSGFALELYCTGCFFHCKNCHNRELWTYDPAYLVSVSEFVDSVLSYLTNPLIVELQIMGGEPLFSDYRILFLTDALRLIKEKTEKPIVLFTGYDLDDLDLDSDLFLFVDFLKTGKYIENFPEVRVNETFVLASSNQHIYKLHPFKKIV